MLDDGKVEWDMSETLEEDMHNFKIIDSPGSNEGAMVLPNDKRTRDETRLQSSKRQRTEETKINVEVDDELYAFILAGEASGRSIQEVKVF